MSSLAEADGTITPVPEPRHQLRRAVTAALPYVAPAVLVAVALQHIILASTAHLTPWTGGGFGMFSTVDSFYSRIVRPVLVVDGREVPIRLGSTDPLGTELSKAGALPTRARLT